MTGAFMCTSCQAHDSKVFMPLGLLDSGDVVLAKLQQNDPLLTREIQIFRNGVSQDFSDFPASKPVSVYLKSTSNLVSDGKYIYFFSWPPAPPVNLFDLVRIDIGNLVSENVRDLTGIGYNPIFSTVVLNRDGAAECSSNGQIRSIDIRDPVLDCLLEDGRGKFLTYNYKNGIARISLRPFEKSEDELLGWTLSGSNFDAAVGSEIVYASFLNDSTFIALVSRRNRDSGSGSVQHGPIHSELIVFSASNESGHALKWPPFLHEAAVPQLLGGAGDMIYFLYGDEIVWVELETSLWAKTRIESLLPDSVSKPIIVPETDQLLMVDTSGMLRILSLDDLHGGSDAR